MAAVPAHVKVARSKGTQAGFDTWYERMNQVTHDGNGGLPTVQAVLAEVNQAGRVKKDGTFRYPEKALAYYCNKYGLTDMPKTRRAPRKSQATTTATTTATRTATQAQGNPLAGILTPEQVEALEALGFVQADTGNDDVDDTDDDVEIPARSERRNVRRQTQAAAPATQEFPPPRDPDAPATQGKLWKLNAEGPAVGLYVCVINEDGDILAGGEGPVTAGEAYDLIGEHIA